jgi:hypothetical protein
MLMAIKLLFLILGGPAKNCPKSAGIEIGVPLEVQYANIEKATNRIYAGNWFHYTE